MYKTKNPKEKNSQRQIADVLVFGGTITFLNHLSSRDLADRINKTWTLLSVPCSQVHNMYVKFASCYDSRLTTFPKNGVHYRPTEELTCFENPGIFNSIFSLSICANIIFTFTTTNVKQILRNCLKNQRDTSKTHNCFNKLSQMS